MPARTSAQRRFHPQRARSPPIKEAFPSAKDTSTSAKVAFPFINDACSHQNMFVHLPMDAPSWGDTGGHTGAAPTNLHQIPLPAIISCVCPSANCLPATLGHGATREMVGAAPMCPPERPRSGVSIRKRHILTRKRGVSIRKWRAPIRKSGISICHHHLI